jgi:hypothetical protein
MSPGREPIATYTDRLPQVRRSFALYSDRVEVEAVWTLGRAHRNVVRLDDLAPAYTQFYVRNRWGKRAFLIGCLAAATAVVFGQESYAPGFHTAAKFLWGIAGAGLMLTVMSIRKTRFIRFSRIDGKAGLDMAAAGSRKGEMQSFADRVKKQIQKH